MNCLGQLPAVHFVKPKHLLVFEVLEMQSGLYGLQLTT